MKKEIVARIVEKLEAELATLVAAARAAHEAATHEESKAEDQYDTRGLEASYLAGAQAKRAEEIRKAIVYFKNTGPSELQLLTVETAGRKSTYLLARFGAGAELTVDGRAIQVITPDSPLGSELAGARAGEVLEVEVRDSIRKYRVLASE